MVINVREEYRLHPDAKPVIGEIHPLMYESALIICEVDTATDHVLVEDKSDPTLSAWVSFDDLIPEFIYEDELEKRRTSK